jgi:hypothetical protein
MWVNSESVNKKLILQIGKKKEKKEEDKFEEKLMFTVNFNLILILIYIYMAFGQVSFCHHLASVVRLKLSLHI